MTSVWVCISVQLQQLDFDANIQVQFLLKQDVILDDHCPLHAQDKLYSATGMLVHAVSFDVLSMRRFKLVAV